MLKREKPSTRSVPISRVIKVVDERGGGDRIGRLDHGGTGRVHPLVIGSDLVEVAPDFAVLRSTAGVQNADDVPIAAPKMEFLADLRVGKTLRHKPAHYQLAPAGVEPSPAPQMNAVAHFDSRRHDAADRHVHAVRIVYVAQVDDRNHLQGSERLAVAAGGNARLELQVLELGAGEQADQLRIRSLPQDEHVQRVAGRGERGAKTIHQRQHGEQHRHR